MRLIPTTNSMPPEVAANVKRLTRRQGLWRMASSACYYIGLAGLPTSYLCHKIGESSVRKAQAEQQKLQTADPHDEKTQTRRKNMQDLEAAGHRVMDGAPKLGVISFLGIMYEAAVRKWERNNAEREAAGLRGCVRALRRKQASVKP